MQYGGVECRSRQPVVAVGQTRKDGEMHTTLQRLEDLFAHRGDAHVLLTLRGSGPLRFSQLAQRMYERSTVRIADNTIARSLQRLDHDGLIACNSRDPRHPTYRLTRHGDEHAEVIAALVDTLESYNPKADVRLTRGDHD